MKKVKVNIMFLIGILVLSVSVGLVFASFVFNQVVNVKGNIGGVTINSKSYLIYAKDHSLESSNINYSRAEKLRNDTVAVVENIKLKYSATYHITSDTVFIEGKTYYKLVDGTTDQYEAVNVIAGTNTDIGSRYEETRSYSGIDRIGSVYDSTFDDKTYTINSENKSKFSFLIGSLTITITCTISQTNGVITEASVGTSDDEKNYKAVIGVDGLSMVIIDEDITHSSSGYKSIEAKSKLTCSATEDKYYPDENESNSDENESNSNENKPKKYYLSQLGLQFTFTSEIAVYVRIHIQDAWTRTRQYSSNTKELYVMKDVVGGKSPFTIDSDKWYYQESTNYVYLKEMYVPEKNTDGSFKSTTYTFDVNEAYYYTSSKNSAFTDYIDVDVSFTIDIVQANRAKALWKVDPSVDFNFS